MRQLIAGNWKMHLLRAEAAALAGGVRDGAIGLSCDLLICPPVVHLQAVAHLLGGSPVLVGAQDCHQDPKGAHTGDISAPMLADSGASWVILAIPNGARTMGKPTNWCARRRSRPSRRG